MTESIKNKIRKLLNLAQNSGATESEAENAMQMASALMLKYNIEVDPDDDSNSVIKGPPLFTDGKFSEQWHIICSSAAACLFSVQNVLINNAKFGYYFAGRKQSVEMAGEMMSFIIEQVERLYKLNLPKGLDQSARAEFRRSFKSTCAFRVMQRAWEIMEQLKNDDSKAIEYTGSNSLVVVQSIKQQLDEAREFLNKNDNVQTKEQRAIKIGSGTSYGLQAGNNVELNRKVS